MVYVTHDIIEALLLGTRVAVMTAGPAARIKTEIAIDLPRPRTRATLSLPRFSELRELVWGNLMNEARRAELQLEA